MSSKLLHDQKPPPTTKLRQSLAARQAFLTLSVAMLLGFLMALTQILFDYQSEQHSIDRQLQQVLESSSPPAAESLWTLSSDLANGVSEGLVSHPLIVEAKIETITGTLLSHRSRPIVAAPWLVNLSFIFGSEKVELVPLSHEDDASGQTIGRLWLKINPVHARQEFLNRVIVILISGLLKALIFAGGLLALYYATLTRPIQRYANWIEKINPDAPEGWQQAPPSRKQHDELTTFGESTALRFRQARAYFLQLQQARRELKTLNRELEDRVQTRTEELKIALARAEHLATTDELTDLPNRRSFMDQAEKRHAEWLRHKRPYALLMMDLDNFKQVNDTFGHPAGDQVLISVASALRQYTRREDILGRLGGEEFSVLLAGVSEVEAITLSERIRSELAKLPIIFDGKHISVTASFGLVPPELLQESFEEVLKNGDKMLYQAKNNGRNRVCLSQ